jgi:hypothetical protein
VLGAAVFAAALVFVSTSAPGPGLDPDSMAYVGAATSLAQHGRMRVPTAKWDRADSTSSLSLWPPGLPVAIAVPVFLGASPIQSARWINVLAAAATAAAIVLLIAGPVGYAAGVIGVLVVFATQAVFDTQISVLSEPLFIALLLLLLAAMIHARDGLLRLGVLSTAVVMVRYAGAAAPLAVVLWTLSDSRHDMRTRVRRAITVAVIPFLAIVSWFARTAMAPDRHATPKLKFYGDWGATLAQARDTFGEWLAPLLPDGTVQRCVALFVGIVIVGFIVAAANDTAGKRLRRMRVSGVNTLLSAASLLGACYVLVVLASRAFVGGTIPLDWRILAPLIVLVEVSVVAAIGYWWRAYHFPTRAAIALAAATWLGAAATVTVNDAVYAATEGSDFAGSDWRDSPLTLWVHDHAAGHRLYSNWPPALYFHAHRIARELPDTTRPQDVVPFGDQLRKDHGYIVAYDEQSPDFISPETLVRVIGLHRIVRTSDGAVWSADSVAPTDSVSHDSVATAKAAVPHQG